LSHTTLRFIDRADAGRQLAAELMHLAPDQPVILGLTRGGIPVAARVAEALGAPLDMLVVSKVGAPGQPELGLGAVAEGGIQVMDLVLGERVGLGPDELPRLMRSQGRVLDERVAALRRTHPRMALDGRVAIVVDDGLATGSTAHAAVRSAYRAGAARVIIAVPVGSPDAVQRMRSVADDVVCLATPHPFVAVGRYYDHFDQVDDAVALGLLPSRSHPLSDEPAEVRIHAGETYLTGDLAVPLTAEQLVIFAHGSGSSRLSPRNRRVAQGLRDGGIATLLLDLLTEDEARDRRAVFDIDLLADRLEATLAWTRMDPRTHHLRLGLFGASTGAAAALVAAARCPDLVGSVVSRGGRPDLARTWLPIVKAPTLLIVGGDDVEVLRLNREALTRLHCPCALEVVPGAGHLFEEPGALDHVMVRARDWFARSLTARAA
jgi:putative phosphoribosyl transferase